MSKSVESELLAKICKLQVALATLKARHRAVVAAKFRERMLSAMRKARVSQMDLVRKLGVHQVQISDIVHGRRPGYAILPQIARVLGVTVSYLKYGETK